MTILSTQ